MEKAIAILILPVGFILITIILCLVSQDDDDFDGGYGW